MRQQSGDNSKTVWIFNCGMLVEISEKKDGSYYLKYIKEIGSNLPCAISIWAEIYLVLKIKN